MSNVTYTILVNSNHNILTCESVLLAQKEFLKRSKVLEDTVHFFKRSGVQNILLCEKKANEPIEPSDFPLTNKYHCINIKGLYLTLDDWCHFAKGKVLGVIRDMTKGQIDDYVIYLESDTKGLKSKEILEIIRKGFL